MINPVDHEVPHETGLSAQKEYIFGINPGSRFIDIAQCQSWCKRLAQVEEIGVDLGKEAGR